MIEKIILPSLYVSLLNLTPNLLTVSSTKINYDIHYEEKASPILHKTLQGHICAFHLFPPSPD